MKFGLKAKLMGFFAGLTVVALIGIGIYAVIPMKQQIVDVSMEEVARSAQELAGLAVDLQTSIARFKII